jgi:hypothetical protein
LQRLSSSLELQVGQKREWCSDESEHAAEICSVDSVDSVDSVGSIGPVDPVRSIRSVDTLGESVVGIRR